MGKCKEDNCNKHSIYNLPNEKIGIYCNEHKKENMIDIKNKKCLSKECDRRPNFNLPNEKNAIYCNEHKKENMVDINHKKCLENDCDKRPNFNLPNENVGIYCNEHKKENMIDINNKKCLFNDCDKRPNFNLPNKKVGVYCNYHKKENMIDIIHKRCHELNCDISPYFNLPNENIGLYCSKHKKENMVNVKDKRCLEDNCETIPSNKKYNGYCLRCFIFKFPEVKLSRNYKVKETHMTDFIKKQFQEEVITFDKTVGGCSKRRPDVYIDKFTHVIICECDENQHKDTSCENKRMMELFQDFGNRPVVFIRFNPDSYTNETGKKIPSSFKYHKTLDVPMIRDSNEWSNRLNVLKDTINKWVINVPEKELTCEYLFYDL